jgi:phosphatidylserine decarboxylase
VTWTDYDEQAGIRLARGAEMGRFNMGSTVITLFGGHQVQLEENLKTNRPIEMGHIIGSF